MTRRCSHGNCFPDTTCALGHLDRNDCEYWKKQDASEEKSAKQAELPTSECPSEKAICP